MASSCRCRVTGHVAFAGRQTTGASADPSGSGYRNTSQNSAAVRILRTSRGTSLSAEVSSDAPSPRPTSLLVLPTVLRALLRYLRRLECAVGAVGFISPTIRSRFENRHFLSRRVSLYCGDQPPPLSFDRPPRPRASVRRSPRQSRAARRRLTTICARNVAQNVTRSGPFARRTC